MTKQIIVHGGLPKTGSSALQMALHSSREHLQTAGFYYDGLVHSERDPKHQWVIGCLRDPSQLALQNFERFDGAQTVFVSTESVSNELLLFRKEDARLFSEIMGKQGDVRFALVTRAADSWVMSYYKQAIVNQASSIFDFYSTSLLYEEFRDLPQVRLLSDPEALKNRMEWAFGRPADFFEYGPDFVDNILREYAPGISVPPAARDANNISLDDTTAEVLRQLNRTTSTLEAKCAWALVLHTARNCGNNVMQVLAKRARKEAIAALDPQILRSVKCEPNPPLSLTEGQLEAFKEEAALALASLKRR